MTVLQFPERPFITPAREGGWYVLLHNGNGWLCGDRRQALKEFAALIDIEQVRA
jgi:hypothetical protein